MINRRNKVIRLVTLGMLTALGVALMVLGTYLPYPPVPFLKLEPSDMVVLIGYTLFSWPGALIIAVLKSVLEVLINGPTGPYAIGQITALIASLTYVGLLCLCELFFKFSTNKFRWRVVSYIVICLGVASVLTLANYLFVTPIYLGFNTVFDIPPGDFKMFGDFFVGPYALVIFVVYFPFNLLKGLIVTFLYEILFSRVIPYAKARLEL